MATSHVYSGTLAKYVTSANAEDSARVAGWGVTLSMDGQIFGKNYESYTASSNAGEIAVSAKGSVDTAKDDKIVAPGTKNSTGLTVRIKGKPEVATKLRLQMTGEDVYLGAGVYGVLQEAQNVNNDNANQFFVYDDGTAAFEKAASYDGSKVYYEMLDAVEMIGKNQTYASYYPVCWTIEFLNYDGEPQYTSGGDLIMADKITVRSYHHLTHYIVNYLCYYCGGTFTWADYANEACVLYPANQDIDIQFRITWEWPFTVDQNFYDLGKSIGGDTILGKLASAKQLSGEKWFVVKETEIGKYSVPIDMNEVEKPTNGSYHYNLDCGLDMTVSMEQVD